jgi:hypothetical protein
MVLVGDMTHGPLSSTMDTEPFTPDLRNCIISCNTTNTVYIHDLCDLSLRFAFKVHRPEFARFDAAGETLIAQDEDGNVTIINPSRTQIETFADVERQHIAQVLALGQEEPSFGSSLKVNPFKTSQALLNLEEGKHLIRLKASLIATRRDRCA